ncbi:unnamed protein product [Polarella glacialis]|uniref:Cell cycle control protein 50A n=1 Tax=Polarella glacialis TaxID=89957 RepID=A0A813ESL3_POLGL|nr:unnamed protein product [Polarella glacialis]
MTDAAVTCQSCDMSFGPRGCSTQPQLGALRSFASEMRPVNQWFADDLQLRDVDLALKTNPQLSACSPWIQTGTRFNYPCGLVAKSVFNDSYTIIYKERGATNYSHLQVDDSATTIAWAADLAGRYKNLNPEATFGEGQQNQEHFNMWLLERFPPVKCVQVQVSPQNPLVPARVATRVTSTGTRVADCKDYMSSNPTCNFTRNGKPFVCSGAYEAQKVKDWGTESGHFITWMRIAGLPTFRKAWGKVNTKLTAGTTLRVYVEDNFPVLPFYGRKALMLSTSSVLMGRNSFLGYGYIAVGGCCLLFGLASSPCLGLEEATASADDHQLCRTEMKTTPQKIINPASQLLCQEDVVSMRS